MDVSDVVGLVSGLLAIFTFLTGVTSARELLARRSRGLPADPPRRSRLLVVLLVSVPVFAVSMVVTLTQGLAGSDTGGAQFLLLVAGAVLVLLYATSLRRSVPWPRFFLLCVLALGALGFTMGAVSRGEEAESATAGIVIGAAVGLLGLAFRGGAPVPAPRPSPGAGRPDQEREVLRLAGSQGGAVSVGQVGLHTSLTLDEARAVLEDLAARGFCRRRVEASGAVSYWFPDLRTGWDAPPLTPPQPPP